MFFWHTSAEIIKYTPSTSSTESLNSTSGNVGAIAVDAAGGYVYWLDLVADGLWRELWRVDTSLAAPERVAEGIDANEPLLAVDADSIYWVRAPTIISRLVKPAQ